MRGIIRKRDVMAHPLVTIGCFGWRVFLKTLIAGQRQTFLSVLLGSGAFRCAVGSIADLLVRSRRIEETAERTYRSLARKHSDHPAAAAFFEAVADQEREHADLLDVCRAEARRGAWSEKLLEVCSAAVPRLEREMAEAAAAAGRTADLSEGLRLVLRIESSEVNRVFLDTLRACPSAFVKKVDAFRTAVARHLAFVAGEVPRIDRALAAECEGLAAAALEKGD